MSEDRPARLGALGETIRQAVFVAATTRAAVRFVDGDSKLLPGLPGQQHEDRSFSFVQKSMQEYLTALAGMRAICRDEKEHYWQQQRWACLDSFTEVQASGSGERGT